MPDPRPIGFFDSGVGGLSVLKESRLILPNEDFIYYADSAHCPYGIKTSEEIIERSIKICDFLLNQGCKIIVVACNTSSVAGLEVYRNKYSIPIIGMEPAIKPAANASKNRRIGVLATSITLNGNRFSSLVEKFQSDSELYTQPCPGLVELVEMGEPDSYETIELLEKYLTPLMELEIDTLVLGCTHYPFLKKAIVNILGENVNIIDTGHAVAKQINRILSINNLKNSKSTPGKESFFTSGNPQGVKTVIDKLWQSNVEITHLPL
ncbi:MAG: glutamate racemase [Peptococcaceae bacterium]|nr:glutamate racemase [Peptococcaceae bacterium]